MHCVLRITLLIALLAGASGCLTYAVGADRPTRNGYTIATSAEVAAIVVYGSYLAATGENPDSASSSNQLGAGLGSALQLSLSPFLTCQQH